MFIGHPFVIFKYQFLISIENELMSIGIQTDYHEYHERKINFRSKFKIENEFGLLLGPYVLFFGESSCYEFIFLF